MNFADKSGVDVRVAVFRPTLAHASLVEDGISGPTLLALLHREYELREKKTVGVIS